MSFEVGRSYGDYEFLDVIRMSRTEIAYRVRNRLAQRFETLRVLPSHLQNDQQQMERFLREMRVHARLSHPHIVAFYHAGELERHVVMTTEYVEGVTLRDRLALGPMPWQTAVDYMRQALSALACAHAQQIVHRDVTPENMIVTPEATLKLNGFGLAKGASSPQLTQLGAAVGSPKYTSPEQIKGSSKIDGRSDLYSLGAVLYEALAGRPPFSFSSQFELMLAQVSQTPEPPSRVNFLVPPALDAVVLRALEKDPGRRFQTAEEFGAALENVKLALERPSAGEGAVVVSVEAAARPAELSAGPAVSPVAPPSEPAVVAAPVAAPPEVVAPVAEVAPVTAPAEVVAPVAEAALVTAPPEVVAPVVEAAPVGVPAEAVASVAEVAPVAASTEVVAPVVEAAPVTAPAEVVAPVAEAAPVTAPAVVVTPVVEAAPVTAPAVVVAPVVEAAPVTAPAVVVTPVVEAAPVAAPAEVVTPVVEAAPVAVPAEATEPVAEAVPVVAPVAEPAPVAAPAEAKAPAAPAPRDWESVPLFQNLSPPGLGWRDFAIAAVVLCAIVGAALFFTMISSK